jgi:hypothetical protein
MSNRQRKRLNELGILSSAELRDQLNSLEGRSKGVRLGRRRLKSALDKAEAREGQTRQAREHGNEKASKRVKCIQLIDPDRATSGETIARFEGTNVIIRKGHWDESPLIVGKKREDGTFFAIDKANYYEVAVRVGHRIIEEKK